VEKSHESITEEGTVNREICIQSQRNSVAMHCPDLCDGGSSGVTGVQGFLKAMVVLRSWSYRPQTETLL